MDAQNSPIQHIVVFIITTLMVLAFKFLGGIAWSTSLARASLVLLFLILIIGPITKLKKPANDVSPLILPWVWRGELGIWFAITALAHFIIVVSTRPFSSLIRIGGSGFSLANLVGLIALVWTILLAITSFRKIILFLGTNSWKWLHGSTHVVFYLIIAHFVYFQFFSTYGKVGPDWFGSTALIVASIIVFLQLITFIVVMLGSRKPTK